MIKIAIMADLHANLPALLEVLKGIEKEKCDKIYHLGDAISIGCYPKECLDLLFESKVKMIMGNHEEYFAYGLEKPQPKYISDGEFLHQKWTHSNLNIEILEVIKKFPLRIDEKFYNTKISFIHCPFDAKQRGKYTSFKDLRNKSTKELDWLFNDIDADIVAYGHTHLFSDIEGEKRYINPGSIGCHKEAVAKYTIISFYEDHYEVKHCKVKYDKKSLIEEMENRQVPDRELILKAFFKE